MTPEQRRLAERITKLLALASSTTFAAEAETARAIAHQLMADHNIESAGKPDQNTIEVRRWQPFAKGARWEGIIAIAITEVCMCMAFWNDDLDSYSFVGTIWNLDCLQFMLAEVNRQRIAAWLAYKAARGPDSFHKFCYGFAKALERKCDAIVDQAAYRPNHDKLKLWYETNILHRSSNAMDLSLGPAASRAGQDAGQGASLHRGSLDQPHKLLGRP